MDIIYFSNSLWNSMKQRPHHIVCELSKNNRVLFVNPPTNIYNYFFTTKEYLLDTITKIPNSELYISKAICTLPFKNYFKIINSFYQYLLTKKIKKIIKKYQFDSPVVWLTFPNQASQISKYGEEIVCYECMDEYSELEKTFNNRFITQLEDEILKKATIVIATSNKLKENKSLINKNTYLSTNAADFGFFNRIITDQSIRKIELFNNTNKTVGYIGAIREWVDIQLIYGIAKKRKDWNFLIVGPLGINVKDLRSLPNVILPGQIPFDELLPYLKAMDVTIVPFVLNNLIDNTNPIKIYEYLAAGKPVVVTPFPEAFNFQDNISIASGIDDFINTIEHILNSDNKNKIEERVNFAKINSWQARVKKIMDLIELHSN